MNITLLDEAPGCFAGYDNATETKKHDADAIRYLSYVLYPLLAGYAVYALYYETHKSWYSFILNTLVGAVYMFGFILMCPQVSATLCTRAFVWSFVPCSVVMPVCEVLCHALCMISCAVLCNQCCVL